MSDEILKCRHVLEVEQNASMDEIRLAYKTLEKVWHPDRFVNDHALQAKANEKLKAVNRAYEILLGHYKNLSSPESGLKPGRQKESQGSHENNFTTEFGKEITSITPFTDPKTKQIF